jgi:hypothetical protein
MMTQTINGNCCVCGKAVRILFPQWHLYIKGLMMKAKADSRTTASHMRNRHWYPGHKFWTLHLPSDCTLLEKKLMFAEAAIAATMEMEAMMRAMQNQKTRRDSLLVGGICGHSGQWWSKALVN